LFIALTLSTSLGASLLIPTAASATGTATVAPDHLVLSPATATITAGGSPQAYTVQGYDALNNFLGDVTAATTLTISPNGGTTGAWCDNTAHTCTAAQPGTYTITGTDGTATGTATLQVNLGQLTLSPSTATVTAGTLQEFDPSPVTAQYVSMGISRVGGGGDGLCNRESVTGVNPGGGPPWTIYYWQCEADQAGTYVVTARSSSYGTAAAVLQVNPLALNSLSLSPSATTVVAGAAQAYTATGLDVYGNSVGDVTGSTSLYISPNGAATGALCENTAHTCAATQAGTYTIYGQDGSATGSTTLQVTPGGLDHLALSPSTTSVTAGMTQTYADAGFDVYGNNLGNATAATTLTIAPNGAGTGATCNNSTHACTATRAGTYAITGTDGTATGTATLLVNPGGLDHLTLSPASGTLSAGATLGYTATARDKYANNLGDVTPATILTINPNADGTGASCDYAAHTCTATQAGTYTITGMDGTASGTATLTVNPAGFDHLGLLPATATVGAGTAEGYTERSFDVYGNNLGNVTAATALTITPNGGGTGASCDYTAHTCTATQAGTYTITGTDGSATGTATLTVTPAGLNGLVLSPLTATVTAGAAQAYKASGLDAYGNSLDVTPTASLTISPYGGGTGASCNNTAHTCTATHPGTYTVTATDGAATNTATLTVTSAPLNHLVLSPATATVMPGTPQAYMATGADTYSNGLGDMTSATTLTITPNGGSTGASCDNSAYTCTATQAGTYTVTGTDGSFTGAATLTVTPAALNSLMLSPATATVTTGTPQAYTPTGVDVYGNSLGNIAAATNLTITPNGGGTGATCNSATHTCTASQDGVYTVTASDAGQTANATLTIVPKFTLRPGLATSISVGRNGSVWSLGANPVSGNYPIYHWNGIGWNAVAGAAVRIAVDPAGNPWIVNSAHHIYHWNGKTWIAYPGTATDIGVGANGALWILGANPAGAGNYSIYHWNGKTWAAVAGAAIRIAVDPAGNPWIVNSAHHIYHWNGKGWTAYPGAAADIAVAANGSIWVLGTAAINGGHQILLWNGNSWLQMPGGAVRVAGGPSGNPWIINSAHQIYSS
jgi:hypothetical protein